MIVDTLQQAARSPLYHPVIRETLTHICTLDLAALPAGETALDGRNIYLNRISATTRAFSEQLAELHRRYIDIHCLISGQEYIGAASHTGSQQPLQPFDEQKDFTLFQTLDDESMLSLSPGTLALFFPGEPHRPLCHLTQAVGVEKVVVKIDAALLI